MAGLQYNNENINIHIKTLFSYTWKSAAKAYILNSDIKIYNWNIFIRLPLFLLDQKPANFLNDFSIFSFYESL